ncbi:MAG TPA: hypothetical protein PL143_18250, partial [Rhodocyclaceae bacterium]|nr:hypothetical protein [Rhodocyclaceae bacterium]
NPCTPPGVLPLLRQDGYALHRAMLVEHRRLADADRWQMRDDPDPEVRFRIFRHFARRDGHLGVDRQAAQAPAADRRFAATTAALQHPSKETT